MKAIKTRTIILVLSALLIIAVAISTPYTKNWFQWGAYIFLGTLAGISAIGQIVELLGRKKDLDTHPNAIENNVFDTTNPFRPKQPTDSIELFRTSVALWGPVASGKSCLINAFAYSLLTKYSESVDGLKYDLSSVSSDWEDYFSNLYKLPPPTILDRQSASQVFRFERRRTTNSRREALSSFAHEISIFDYSGEYSEILFRDNNDDDFINHVMTNIASADIILVALDSEQKYLSKDQYHQYFNLVKRMFEILNKINPNKKRFYAMCLTKADTIPAGIDADPNGLIELKFGSRMLEMFKQISEKHEIQTFITSSIGFLPSTNKPNIQVDNSTIIDKEHWKPYGVEFPFFWAFEAIEKTRLKSKLRFGKYDIKNYIEYPRP